MSEGNDIVISSGEQERIGLFINSIKKRMPTTEAVSFFDNEEIDSNVYATLVEASKNLTLEDQMRVYGCASKAATDDVRYLLKNSHYDREMTIITVMTSGKIYNNTSPFYSTMR